VATLSREWVCGRSIPGIAGSNPTGGMDVCLCCVVVVRCQVDTSASGRYSSTGVLPSVVRPMSLIAKPIKGGYDPESGRSTREKKMSQRLFQGITPVYAGQTCTKCLNEDS